MQLFIVFVIGFVTHYAYTQALDAWAQTTGRRLRRAYRPTAREIILRELEGVADQSGWVEGTAEDLTRGIIRAFELSDGGDDE